MTYEEKLKQPSWQKRRLLILERDGWKCVYCSNADRQLEVHHKIYLDLPNPADYPNDLLITLCKVCHKKESKRPIEERMLANTLRLHDFMVGDIIALSCKLETDIDFTKRLLKTLREFQNG